MTKAVSRAFSWGLVIAFVTFAYVAVSDSAIPCFAQAQQPELRPVNPEFKTEPGCPIEVTNARTDMEVDPFGTPIAARHYIDYRNISNKQVTAVKFRIGYVGNDGRIQLPYLNAPDGHAIDPSGQASGKWRGDKVPGNCVGVKMRVIMVKFGDGTVWESEKLTTPSGTAQSDNGGFAPLTAEPTSDDFPNRVPGTPVQFRNYGSQSYGAGSSPAVTATPPAGASPSTIAHPSFSGGGTPGYAPGNEPGGGYQGTVGTGPFGAPPAVAGSPSSGRGSAAPTGVDVGDVNPGFSASTVSSGSTPPASGASVTKATTPTPTAPSLVTGPVTSIAPRSPIAPSPAPAIAEPVDPLSEFDNLMGRPAAKPATSVSPAAAPSPAPATPSAPASLSVSAPPTVSMPAASSPVSAAGNSTPLATPAPASGSGTAASTVPATPPASFTPVATPPGGTEALPGANAGPAPMPAVAPGGPSDNAVPGADAIKPGADDFSSGK